jgi:hypothetical protein
MFLVKKKINLIKCGSRIGAGGGDKGASKFILGAE